MIRTWIVASAVSALFSFGAWAETATQMSVASDDAHMEHIEGYDPNEPAHVEDPAPPNLYDPAPLKVRYDRLSKISGNLRTKILATKAKLDRILASGEFRTAVLNHQYGGRKTFVQSEGLSNSEIYDRIQLGKEVLSGVIDRLMNLELEAYYDDNDVVGRTFTNSRTIYVNRKFYDRYTSAQIARNLMHEWLHKIGFSHDSDATSRRPYSVPYAIGEIVERLLR